MIDVVGGYLDIPAVENGGFQDDRCRFKLISILVMQSVMAQNALMGNGQSYKLLES